MSASGSCTACSVVIFGDTYGLPRLLSHVGSERAAALVRAGIRPEQAPPLTKLAREHDLPLLVQPPAESGDFPAFIGALKELSPDVLLVDSYSMLLPPAVLALAPRGGANVHGALLPEFRGVNPIQWALLEDARETGVTVHALTEAFDAGPVYGQRRVPIHFADTWLDIQGRIGVATEELLSDVVPGILAGTAKAVPQDESRARYHRRRTRDDGRIDFSQPVLSIYNLIRALVAPHPGAFYLDAAGGEVILDRRLTIAEVAALKFGPEGNQSLRLAGSEARVHATTGDDELAFDLEDGTLARISSIDWSRRTAEVGQTTPALRRDLEAIAYSELGLAVESPRGA